MAGSIVFSGVTSVPSFCRFDPDVQLDWRTNGSKFVKAKTHCDLTKHICGQLPNIHYDMMIMTRMYAMNGEDEEVM